MLSEDYLAMDPIMISAYLLDFICPSLII